MYNCTSSAARNTPIRIRMAGTVLAGAALVTLGACSSGSDAGTAVSSSETVAAQSHNAADVTFSTDMIPHHRQAVEMAQLASTRAADPRVTRLATQIAAAQTPEITALSNRLRSWGAPVPADTGMGSTDHGSMDHGSMDGGSSSSMNGMMSEGDMTELAALRGTAFDAKWLTMMIAHHTGAVAMSKTELADGQDQASKALAEKIIAAQESEITQMRTILAG